MKPMTCTQVVCDRWIRELDPNIAAAVIELFIAPLSYMPLERATRIHSLRLVSRVVYHTPRDRESMLLRSHDFNQAICLALKDNSRELVESLVLLCRSFQVTTGIEVAAQLGFPWFFIWINSLGVDACWGGSEMIGGMQWTSRYSAVAS